VHRRPAWSHLGDVAVGTQKERVPAGGILVSGRCVVIDCEIAQVGNDACRVVDRVAVQETHLWVCSALPRKLSRMAVFRGSRLVSPG
jgi:hypothetical protein